MIRPWQKEDLEGCAKMLMAAYNREPWRNRWTPETALRYLGEFAGSPQFAGWVSLQDGRLAGALFGRRKTWWTQDELFIEELFVHPDFQGQGHGKALLRAAEAFCVREALAGVTLLTDRNMPAKSIYERLGYATAGHVVFMYRLVSSARQLTPGDNPVPGI